MLSPKHKVILLRTRKTKARTIEINHPNQTFMTASSHTKTCSAYTSFLRQQNQMVAPCKPPRQEHH